MRKNGYDHLVDVAGGIVAIEETGINLTDFICPSTLTKN